MILTEKGEMMEQNRMVELNREIDGLSRELAELTIRLVNIKSTQGEPLPGAPFGTGPKQVLDEMLRIGKENGFFCTDYGTGVISLALREGKPDLGIWLHSDVVPAGDGWRFDPFHATEYKNCIIGRGATDNKGQIAAAFYLLLAFRKLNIPLNFNPALYIGSNEESGMADLTGIPGNPDAKGFLNVAEPPRLSLVPDGGFSVGYGGKGKVNLILSSNTPFHGCTLTAGTEKDPGLATAKFDREFFADPIAHCTVSGNELSSWTAPKHGAHPDPDGNMITRLAEAVLENGLSHPEDLYIWEFLKEITSHVYGETLGIATQSEEMSPLTVFTGSVETVDGCCRVNLGIRYPIGITGEEILKRVRTAAEKRNFSLTDYHHSQRAYLAPKDTPVVDALCKASDEFMDKVIPPYTLSGGTYAHHLPNAYVFGMNGCLPPDDFPKGKGGAHGVDESVSLARLKRAMRIYARALLSLNDLDW